MSNLRGVPHSLHCDCVDPNNIPDMSNVSREEFEVLSKQVADMHQMMSALAAALNNPMLKSMLPPQIRAMFGG